MPPSGYLTEAGIQSCLYYLAYTFPSICNLIVLPEQSVEMRTVRAVRIGKDRTGDRHGVLFIGGVHAREIINPDLLVSFALKLCRAYTDGTGLNFGGASYTNGIVNLIVENLDVFILPLVNPDGRIYVQSPTGDPWWRKNRSVNAGSTCRGVDINRNYDFLWSSGIGTSSSACSEVFKGSGAFSEPETRNVRHLLDAYPNINCMIDVHSYSELVLYPWGDDNNQTTDPTMNFQNPAFNGLRGTPGDSIYKEYIPQEDLDWFIEAGERVRDAIAASRGRIYTLQQSILLYPTTGTAHDYAYSRFLVDGTKSRVYAYTLETAREFQPVYSEALNVMAEVSAGLVEFCLACLCVVEEVTHGTALAEKLDTVRGFRRRRMLATPAGRRYNQLLEANSAEILELAMKDDRLRKEGLDLLERVVRMVEAADEKPEVLDKDLINAVEQLAKRVERKASPALKEALEEIRSDLKHFEEKTIVEGLEAASREAGERGS